ncbi:sensor histidine kinase [Blastococcus sp. TBT05-19]|uniref:sensor histidine kinase n=1 Tax=Blastococcus sp. TBT05-19 TaxID=2250581 RepID=UPI000DEBE537|nr:sensor histidine kinase [Blastococcus sp. TBT05-19]RBY92346.1 sensor histidine kinase [Blastococcus sp. TBT05-19]
MAEAVDAGPVVTGGRGPATRGHAHVGLVARSDEELLAGAVPHLEDGLRAGDTVLLSCPPETAALITSALGEQASAVSEDARICLLGTRVADAVAASVEWVRRAASTGSGRLRIVGQMQFGAAPRNFREGLRYEAAKNRFFATDPVSALCLFDERVLPAEVLAGVAPTHPELLVDGRVVRSEEFGDPREYAIRLPLPREPVEDGSPVLLATDAPSLAVLRGQLRSVIHARVADRDQAEDLHFAASEVASNAFRHGDRPVSARVWVDGDRLVCAITDSGRGFDDPFAGFRPAHGEDLALGGMGLWLARKLWDHVDVLPQSRGVTVRLSSRLV